MMARITAWNVLGMATVLLVCSLLSCVVSPVPQPPNVQPELHVTDIIGGLCDWCDGIIATTFDAPAGSVTHPDGVDDSVIWVVDLDSDRPPQTFPVNPDGSFSAMLEGFTTDVYRVQARLGAVEVRSDPVDLVIPNVDQPVVELDHALADCFIVTPSLELVFEDAPVGETMSIELRNECAGELRLDQVELRVPTDAFTLDSSTETVLSAGETTELFVELSDDGPGLREAILLIEVSSPSEDRRAITLIAPNRSD